MVFFAWNVETFDITLVGKKLFLHSVNVFFKAKSLAGNITLQIFSLQRPKKTSNLTTFKLPKKDKHFYMSYPATEINKQDTLCEINAGDGTENMFEYLSIYFDVQIK